LENECSKNPQKLCSSIVVESKHLPQDDRIIELSKIRHENGDIFKNALSKKGLE
jgi:hypothetical protein